METSYTPVRIVEVNGSMAISPTLINSYSMLTVPAYWRAMRFLSKNLASFPRCVTLKGVEPEKAHPLSTLLYEPNHLQTGFIFFQTLFFHFSHTHNGYAKVTRDGVGNPTGLHTLQPEWIRPFRVLLEGFTPSDPAGWLQFYYVMPTGEIIAGEDVIHLADITHDGMVALAPEYLHEPMMQRATSLDKYQTKFLLNGTVVRGVVSFKDQLSPEQLTEAKTNIRLQFMGPNATDDLMILDNGATFTNATMTPEDSQMTQQSALTVKDVSRITDVPPEFLFELAEAKYNASVELAGQFVVRFTFRPIIEMAEAELSQKLLSKADRAKGYRVNLETGALERGDTAATVAKHVALKAAGIENANEAREDLGLPESQDPDATKLKVSGDTSPAGAKPTTATPPAK